MATLVGIPYETFVEEFEWTNLYGEEAVNPALVSDADARSRADLLRGELARFDRVILLGGKVARAFGLEETDKYTWVPLEGTRAEVALMPHTSQTNWNTRGEAYWAPARRFARTLRPESESPRSDG